MRIKPYLGGQLINKFKDNNELHRRQKTFMSPSQYEISKTQYQAPNEINSSANAGGCKHCGHTNNSQQAKEYSVFKSNSHRAQSKE